VKKNVLLLLTLLSMASFVFASGFANNQKIYPVDTDIIDAITFLYLGQGHAVPSASAPYSRAEYFKMLDKLDVEHFSEEQRSVYDYAIRMLNENIYHEDRDGVSYGWDFSINLENYLHSNTDFNTRELWVRDYQDQKPFLAFSFQTWPGDLFYGYFEGEVANIRNLTGGFGSKNVFTNIPMVSPNVFDDLSLNFPYRSFVSVGGDFWSVQLGRDRMNWGNGVSGNLFLGDNVKYHNMLRAAVFGDKFKYTFVSSFFPHPKQYVSDAKDHNCLKGAGQEALLDGIYMFMAHRLEWRSFGDRLNISLSEGIMYQSEENLIDLRVLALSGLYHNYYIRSNANSLLGLEVEFTPVKNLSLYAQAVVDEFALPGEPRPSATKSGFPQAMGFLGGVKYYKVLPGSLAFKASFEAAKTDPFLYLRYGSGSNSPEVSSPSEYGLSYVVAVREFGSQSNVLYNSSFLGYRYGCDAITFNLNAGLKSFGRWNVEANGFYMLHGTHDMFTAWAVEGGSNGVTPGISTPTSQHETTNYNDPNAQSERNAVSRTVVLGLHGAYIFNRNFNAFAQLDYTNIRNQGNIRGQDANDFQLTIGASYIM
jgi:hypothetical protein